MHPLPAHKGRTGHLQCEYRSREASSLIVTIHVDNRPNNNNLYNNNNDILINISGYNPVWDQELTFKISVPSLAMVWFRAYDDDSENVGEFVLPFCSVSKGIFYIYACVCLYAGKKTLACPRIMPSHQLMGYDHTVHQTFHGGMVGCHGCRSWCCQNLKDANWTLTRNASDRQHTSSPSIYSKMTHRHCHIRVTVHY